MVLIIRLLLLVTILSTSYSNLLTKAYILRKVYKRYSSSRISTTSSTTSTTNSINDDNKYLIQRNAMSQTQLFLSNDDDNYISNNNNNDNIISKYFVPIFVSVWAIGYSLLALVETTSGGIGDMGGILGVGLVLVLFFGLLGVTAFESFKDDKRYND